MAQWRNFLGRFRPVGAPGAAAPRGVPADRIAEAAIELAPLLALLDEIDAEAEQIRSQATAEAEKLRSDGARQAAAIVTRARGRSESMADEVAAGLRSRVAAEQAELDSAHAIALDRLRMQTTARMAGYVERVVVQARALIVESPVR